MLFFCSFSCQSSSPHWSCYCCHRFTGLLELYQGFVSGVLVKQESIALGEVRARIDKGDLRTALTMLKLCPYSDDLLEVGYELGILLESGKHWASALNLYHWLSIHDPGMSDFVGRIEEIRNNRAQQLKLEKTRPVRESRTADNR